MGITINEKGIRHLCMIYGNPSIEDVLLNYHEGVYYRVDIGEGDIGGAVYGFICDSEFDILKIAEKGEGRVLDIKRVDLATKEVEDIKVTEEHNEELCE